MTAPEGKREFRILGPLRVRDEGRVLPLGARKQRALLALLLLEAERGRFHRPLIDALWGETPPESAAWRHVHVSQLRKALGERTSDARRPRLRLALEPGSSTSAVSRRFAREGRTSSPPAMRRRAARLTRGARALAGPPLEDFGSEPFAQAEIARLEGRRLAALEARIEADLALGRHDDLVPELERSSATSRCASACGRS